jgi:hypothetical protein
MLAIRRKKQKNQKRLAGVAKRAKKLKKPNVKRGSVSADARKKGPL